MAPWSDLRVAVDNVDLERVRACLDRGDDINEVAVEDQFSLLHLSIDAEVDQANNLGLARPDSRVSRLLLERGIDTELRNKYGETARDMAVSLGHDVVADLL